MQGVEDQAESNKSLGAHSGEKRWYKSVVLRLLSQLYKDIVQRLITTWFADKHLKQREHVITALSYIAMGITSIFARQYIQTDNTTIINISLIVSLLLLILGIYHLCRVYPHILLWIGVTYVFCAIPSIAIMLYYLSQMIPRARQTDRTISFIFMIFTIFEFFALISYLLDLYEKNKENIKVHFSLKNISVVTLGILTMGTALFQFMQVLLPFIHH